MSDYDWADIDATLGKIMGGEDDWGGTRKAAHEALVECSDAIKDGLEELGFEAEMPHIGDRPDWRRMPDKASTLAQVVKTILEHTPGEGAPEPQGGGAAPMSTLSLNVMERLLEGGGVTMAQLREITEADERALRGAIKEIRARYQSDHGEHPVNYSGRWWTARELEAMGKDLQATARGTLKVVSAKSGTDFNDVAQADRDLRRESYQSKPRSELLDEVRDLLEGHPDAEKVVLEVVSRIDESFAAKQNYKDVCKEAAKAKERAEVNVKEAVEAGREANDSDAASVQLDSIQSAWQAKEEILAHGVEERKEARERKKRAEAALEQLMSNLKQMELPGVS